MFGNSKPIIKSGLDCNKIIEHMSQLLDFINDQEDERAEVWAQDMYQKLHAMLVTIYLVGPSPNHTGGL